MKIPALLVGSILCFTVFSQKELNTNIEPISKKTETAKTNPSTQEFTYKVDEGKLAKKNQDNTKTVAYYNDYILAIETKVNLIKNDPNENAIAIENGWYAEMESYLLDARAKRKVLMSNGK